MAAVSAIRFCRTCGEPWDAQWETCPHCQLRRPASVAALRQPSAEKRAIVSTLCLYFALLGISIVTIFYLTVTKTELSLPAELVQTAAMCAVVLGWCIPSWRVLAAMVVKRFRPAWLAAAAGLAVPTFLIATAIVGALHRFAGAREIEYLQTYRASGFGIGLAVLLVCVQPAVFEELAFRGVILSSLQKVIGDGEAILVSAGMFAILHLSMPSVPHLFLLGALLAWLRVRSGSLVPGMVLHFSHNLLVVLAENWSILSW